MFMYSASYVTELIVSVEHLKPFLGVSHRRIDRSREIVNPAPSLMNIHSQSLVPDSHWL